MDNFILVESKEIFEKFSKIIPSEFKIINLTEIYALKKNKIEILINEDDYNALSNAIKEADNLYIVYTDNYINFQEFYIKSFEDFEIEFFNKVTLDNLEINNIQYAFNAAIEIEHNEINYIIARFKIDKIIKSNVSKILKWFFKKEQILTDEEAEKLDISRLILYAATIIIKNQDKINSFIPDTYDKIGVDYIYENIQFRVKNNKKFKKDMQEELMMYFNIISDSKNEHTITNLDRKIKDIPAPLPLTKTRLQKECSYLFGFSPKETLKIAKELFEGIEIAGEKISLITSINTNSTRIDKGKKFQIYNLINKYFGKDFYFNGTREVKENSEYQLKEAIVPTKYEEEFFPDKIKSFLSEEQYRIYYFIFWITICSEMSNAQMDASEIVVNIGTEKMKTESNKIIFEGWLVRGKELVTNLNISDTIVEIPLNLYPSMRLNDFKIDTVIYPVPERTPMRYSTGRFFEKTNKDILAEEEEISLLIDDLLEQKLIVLRAKSMIEPTEKFNRIYYTLEEYAPELVNETFFIETFLALVKINEGKLEKQVLIDMYMKQLSILREKLGYSEVKEFKEDNWKKEEAKKIAKENNQHLPKHVLDNNVILSTYIKENENRVEKFGICPNCKSGEICEKSKSFICNKCDFILWKNSVLKFFEIFGKDIEIEIFKEYLKIILSKGKLLIENFYSKEVFFNKEITIEYSEKYNKWQVTFFNNKTKSNVQVIEENKDIETKTNDEELNDDEELNKIIIDFNGIDENDLKNRFTYIKNIKIGSDTIIYFEGEDFVAIKNFQNIKLYIEEKYNIKISEDFIKIDKE
ncbi:hypothetical protein CP985_10300 [Malaciobacter mytili LMG 24559]|uniref:Topo IA-type catalytic domain-containing protein n=1 Tax=Malaciobacter mytili LMG 24559 TaxID=1032238 RepID=A0AAX2AHV4_9BACT|nr:DNA topoisomerase [Malaciobacter mytili]AXH16426.1 DNA topoisomerase I [Malaciobacter mytili LMG 24559]RXK15086.1 hypothetical protein CP985_10300 [Malaciobacter mytili LMG 24559]